MKFDLGLKACGILEKEHTLVRKDIGQDASLSSGGIVLETECFAAADFGRICMLSMEAPGGAMKMETVLLVPVYSDVPLLNLDRVITPSGQTQIIELYDVQITPYPEALLAEYQELKEEDGDIAEMPGDSHWYDTILYPCSYHKTGTQTGERFQKTAERYLHTFAGQLRFAKPCDPEEKGCKIRTFAERLYSEGGPAVEQIKMLFGEETAKRLILDHMYGV